MSELAQNANGERVAIHDNTEELKVLRCQEAGKPGAPSGVAAPNGLQAYLPRNARIDDLKTITRGKPGRYKLVQVDKLRQPVAGAEAFFVEVFDLNRAEPDHDDSDRDSILREMVRTHGEIVRTEQETVRTLFAQLGLVIEASGALIRAADGAGIAKRKPIDAEVATNVLAQVQEPEPAAQTVPPHLQMIFELAGELGPLVKHVILTKVVGLSPEQAAAFMSAGTRAATPPPANGNAAPGTASTDAPPPKPEPVDPIKHMNAIDALLAPHERIVVIELFKSMSPDEVGRWRDHLCTLSAADAAKTIKEQIAQVRAKKGAAS